MIAAGYLFMFGIAFLAYHVGYIRGRAAGLRGAFHFHVLGTAPSLSAERAQRDAAKAAEDLAAAFGDLKKPKDYDL